MFQRRFIGIQQNGQLCGAFIRRARDRKPLVNFIPKYTLTSSGLIFQTTARSNELSRGQ